MKLNQILTISGKPGLYQLQSRTRSGFLALSLLDQKRISIGLRKQCESALRNCYLHLGRRRNLLKKYQAIKEKENGQKTAVSHKATEDELEAYFFSVIPNYDEDKVYPSDIKKIIQWYNILIDKGFLEEAPVASQEAEA